MALAQTINKSLPGRFENSSLNLIPAPQSVALCGGHFRLRPDTVVVATSDAEAPARMLSAQLAAATGWEFTQIHGAMNAASQIELHIDKSLTSLGKEGYRLTVLANKIAIVAPKTAGLLYGTQTLLQLFPAKIYSETPLSNVTWTAPCVEIEDYPRFAWRGAMLDVARRFVPLSYLHKFIDKLVQHKINILQLHLTDDQGWRIEIKKYPRLAEVGGFRANTMIGEIIKSPANDAFDIVAQDLDGIPHGGYYTQDEMRELVAYAAERNITIVPEIEMPGHAQSAVAAYPELGCTDTPLEVSPYWGIHDVLFNPSDETITFLKNVLDEVMDIFPSPYIHIGGDEAVKKQWRASAACQSRIAELGLKDEAELQSWFVTQIDAYLAQNGRRMVGWDEILEGGLAKGAIVMSWRGEEGGTEAARHRHDVVMAPHRFTYLDYYQAPNWPSEPLASQCTLTLEKIYGYDPIPQGLPREFHSHVLGSQGQLWSEFMPDTNQIEFQAFPRLCALSEAMWSTRDTLDFEGFVQRLRVHIERLKLSNTNYRPLDQSVEAEHEHIPLSSVA